MKVWLGHLDPCFRRDDARMRRDDTLWSIATLLEFGIKINGSMPLTKPRTYCPSFRTRESAIRNPGQVERRLDSGLRRSNCVGSQGEQVRW